MPAITLFLDFDGVVHPTPCSPAQYFMQVHHVESLLREFDDLQVVISSSWRLTNSIELMRAEFTADLAHRIVGTTPELPGKGAMHREQEIQLWLAHNAKPDEQPRWVAVDDVPQWFTPSCPNLHVTNPAIGLDANAAEGLRWKLLRLAEPRHAARTREWAVMS